MSITTLSPQSQLVLPPEVRQKLGIRPGDRLIVEVEEDHAVIRKAPESDVEALARFRSSLWNGYARELDQARDEWDR